MAARKGQDQKAPDSINDRVTEPDEVRVTKTESKLKGSGDKYFGEYGSQQSVPAKEGDMNLNINVGQLDTKGFLPISFRKQEADGAGKRSSRKPSVHGFPQ